jgi:hypothetical protein
MDNTNYTHNDIADSEQQRDSPFDHILTACTENTEGDDRQQADNQLKDRGGEMPFRFHDEQYLPSFKDL